MLFFSTYNNNVVQPCCNVNRTSLFIRQEPLFSLLIRSLFVGFNLRNLFPALRISCIKVSAVATTINHALFSIIWNFETPVFGLVMPVWSVVLVEFYSASCEIQVLINWCFLIFIPKMKVASPSVFGRSASSRLGNT